jgi:CheY-like chemotaxis protein
MNKVLLVDDEWLIVQALQDLFAELGFDVAQAQSGDQAVAHLGKSDNFDLLVTDVLMPGVIDGKRLAEIFRSRCPAAGIIYITGSPEMLSRTVVLGPFDEVVGKPFGFRELTEVVRRTIARVRAEAPVSTSAGTARPATAICAANNLCN